MYSDSLQSMSYKNIILTLIFRSPQVANHPQHVHTRRPLKMQHSPLSVVAVLILHLRPSHGWSGVYLGRIYMVVPSL